MYDCFKVKSDSQHSHIDEGILQEPDLKRKYQMNKKEPCLNVRIVGVVLLACAAIATTWAIAYHTTWFQTVASKIVSLSPRTQMIISSAASGVSLLAVGIIFFKKYLASHAKVEKKPELQDKKVVKIQHCSNRQIFGVVLLACAILATTWAIAYHTTWFQSIALHVVNLSPPTQLILAGVIGGTALVAITVILFKKCCAMQSWEKGIYFVPDDDEVVMVVDGNEVLYKDI